MRYFAIILISFSPVLPMSNPWQVIQDDVTGQIEEPVNGWAMVDGFGVSPCPVTLMYGASGRNGKRMLKIWADGI